MHNLKNPFSYIKKSLRGYKHLIEYGIMGKLKMFSKKSQATGAAILVMIITIVIVIYILMLPPADRAEILGEQPTTVSAPGYQSGYGTDSVMESPYKNLQYTGKETLMQETPGRIDYTALNELEIPLNAFNLFKTTSAEVVEEFNPFTIKNGVGDVSGKNLTFELDDNLQNMDNIILTFKAKKHEGILTIKLNGETIYEYDIDTPNPSPVKIKKGLLNYENALEFSVDSVGMQFWKTNEYSLEDLQLMADITDTSRQESQNTFFVTEEQGSRIERAVLRFNPDCYQTQVGKLTIMLNGRTVFSGVPDCGSLNFAEFAPNMVIIGKNKVDFSTERGSYLIDQIKVKLEFMDNAIPVYYFEIDDSLFNLYFEEVEPECGKKDSYCPELCDEDNDYDCCMQEYTTPYWCVAKTANEDDKCIGFVTEDNLDRCPTNYVGRNGKVSDEGEDLCGDNHDGDCPPGCGTDYDKDCCFDQDGDQFWCEFMPVNGLDYRCMNSVSLGQCDICPTSYKGEDDPPICSPSKQTYEVEELKSEYGVVLNLEFTDDYQRKEADIYINGHLIRLQTNGALYQRDISQLVEPGTNSVEIVPFSVLNIRELRVDVVE